MRNVNKNKNEHLGNKTKQTMAITRRNDEMKIAAVHAIRTLAKEEVPAEVLAASGSESLVFGKDYIIPKPMDSRLRSAVAIAVAQAAVDSGVAALDMPENYNG